MTIPLPTFGEPGPGYDQQNEAQFRRELTRALQDMNQFVQPADVAGSPTTLASGSTNNYVVGPDTSILRLTPHASGSTLTGIVAPKGNRRITVLNLGSATLTLAHESGSSSADNRFTIGGGQSLTLRADEQAALLYDSTAKRWRVNSSSMTFRGCTAYRTTSDFGVSDSVETAVQWNAEAFDSDAFHDNSTNPSRFTIPSGLAGKYKIAFGVTLRDDGTGSGTVSLQTQLRKGGAALAYSWRQTTAGAYTAIISHAGAVDVDLAAAEYIELHVTVSAAGGSPTWVVGTRSWMSVQFLG